MGGQRGLRRLSSLVCASISVAAMATEGRASPWSREDDQLFISSRTDYFIARSDAPIPPSTVLPRFERVETHAYFEFGVTKRAMVGGKLIYGSSTYVDGFFASAGSGFSEIEVFAQRQIFRSERHALGVSLTAGAPIPLETGVRPGLHSDGADLEARVLYGRDFFAKPFKVYATAEAGYRRRFGDAADQIRADVLLGIEPVKNLLLLTQVFSTVSLRNEDLEGADYDVVKVQPSLVWSFSRRWSLQAGVTHEAAGRNLLRGDAFFVGFWTVF